MQRPDTNKKNMKSTQKYQKFKKVVGKYIQLDYSPNL